jgi:hypothetical protein
MMGFLRAADESGQPGNFESGPDVFAQEQGRSIKSGDEVLYVLAITFDLISNSRLIGDESPLLS